MVLRRRYPSCPFPLHLRAFTRPQRSRRLQQAYASGFLKLVKRLQALLALAQDHSGSDVAERRALGAPTVREARPPSLCKGMASVVDHAPPGRPRKRPHTPRQQRAAGSKASPQDVGSTSGCWHTPMLQDRLQRHCGVASHPPSLAT